MSFVAQNSWQIYTIKCLPEHTVSSKISFYVIDIHVKKKKKKKTKKLQILCDIYSMAFSSDRKSERPLS
jgi:hypothetical protein